MERTVKQVTDTIFDFSRFIVEEFDQGASDQDPWEDRQQRAWKHFLAEEKEKIKENGKCLRLDSKYKRQWFGIGGRLFPKRRQIIALAFELGMSLEQAEKYLRQGLGQSSFQYNDYQEWLFRYGLYHQMSYQRCLELIEIFEEQMQPDQVIQQKTHTQWLKNQFEKNVSMDEGDYLQWMIDHASAFKGYSRQAFHYFELYKDEMLMYLERQERKELDWLLDMTDFREWNKENAYPGEGRQEAVRRYLRYASRCKTPMDKALYKDISKTLQLAYPKRENRHQIIQHLYMGKSGAGQKEKKRYTRMTDKRMSELMHMAEYKEEEIRLSWAFHGQVERNEREGEQTRKQLQTAKSRIMLLNRTDLLPLIHFVAQERYMEELEKEEKEYQQKEAVEYFERLANATLLACGMEPVSEKFAMDQLLLACFGKKEMLSFSEILEITGDHF